MRCIHFEVVLPLQCYCEEERDCNYYTFDVEHQLCYLFATCEATYDCPSCVTGDEQCWQTLGGDCSISPTTTAATSTTTTEGGDGNIDVRNDQLQNSYCIDPQHASFQCCGCNGSCSGEGTFITRHSFYPMTPSLLPKRMREMGSRKTR